MPTSSSPTPRLYRPGESFTSAELQIMAAERLLRRVLWDTYAEAHLSDTAALRAGAVWQAVADPLKEHGVICGQTAAWIHGLGPAPARIHIITPGFFRRQQVGSAWWSIYQVHLPDSDTTTYGGVPVTDISRTTVDLFCGVGAPDSRKRLDQAARASTVTLDHLRHWPTLKEPLRERDDCLNEPSASDTSLVRLRASLIGELLTVSGIADIGLVTKQICDRAPRLTIADVRAMLDQCVSRRFPTVR